MSKSETNPNKTEQANSKQVDPCGCCGLDEAFVWDLLFSASFGFVSDFDIRISDFPRSGPGFRISMDIDLNCDLGEGCAYDAALLPLITSANVSCGWHAGDTATALATLQGAVKHGVRVGAHPGFADREHFGRRELPQPEEQIYRDGVYQIGALIALARAAGTNVAYLKPHGALYNMACRDDACARPVVAVAEFFQLPLLGLPGSRLEALSHGRCRFVAEGFADRRYRPDGSLVPRDQPGAFLHDPAAAVAQVGQLIRERGIGTVCVHGDNPQALAFVAALRQALLADGYVLRAFA
jgi:UPF0271 protein